MIIEFLGVSGVGKTTVAKDYYQKLKASGHHVVWDTYILYAEYGWLKRNVFKALIVIKYGVLHPCWVFQYKDMLKQNLSVKRDIVKLLFNGVFLKSRLVKARRDNNIHIFDEGAMQYLWAIKLWGGVPVNKTDVDVIQQLLGLPDELIVIESKSETIEKRLIFRGEYTKIMDSDNLLKRIIGMQKIQGDILLQLERKDVRITQVDNNEER